MSQTPLRQSSAVAHIAKSPQAAQMPPQSTSLSEWF
jgi:hypothetical protein